MRPLRLKWNSEKAAQSYPVRIILAVLNPLLTSIVCVNDEMSDKIRRKVIVCVNDEMSDKIRRKVRYMVDNTVSLKELDFRPGRGTPAEDLDPKVV